MLGARTYLYNFKDFNFGSVVSLSGQSSSSTKKVQAFFGVLETNKKRVEKGVVIILVHLLKML